MTGGYAVMKILTCLCICLVIVLEVNTKNLDLELKAVKDSTSQFESGVSSSKSNISPVLQKNKKRHATKEVILYLTPSQIKALESGKGLVSIQPLLDPIDPEELINHHLKLQEQTEFVKQEFENLKSAVIQQVEQPNDENSELDPPGPLLQKELLSPENQQEFEDHLRQELAYQEDLKLSKYYYELNKAKHLKLQQEVNRENNAWFTPNIQINEGYQVQEPQQENPSEEKSPLQLKVLSIPSNIENSERYPFQAEKPLLQLKYSPKYNDQEKAIEIEKILRTRHRHELEKQSALSQAEKIANSPAILVHEQVKVTKQRPFAVVKHVEVPVPTPELISIPEPVPVKVPHLYAVPQEVIKRIPVPIAELERPVPYKEESQVAVPFNKFLVLYVDRPHVDQKIVPVDLKAWS